MRRALLSVSDKTGLIDLARALNDAGIELVSSGGTARTVRDAGLPVVPVQEVTGHPEILDGRVKTLHPAVHGGLLARDDAAHLQELEEHGIAPFDLLVVNLYPFEAASARSDANAAEVIEQIDIGGPAMVRAAAKTFERVTVVVDPSDYAGLAESLPAGPDAAARRRLARKAFAHTAAYDAAIVTWLDASADDSEPLPPTMHLALERAEVLRYGENPHQAGARYRLRAGPRSATPPDAGVDAAAVDGGPRGGVWDAAVQHKGTAMSYLNLFDADAAWRAVHAFEEPAVVIVKHANPCGVAVAHDLATAYALALDADPQSAFGGVVAMNRTVDVATAEAVMAAPKADVLIARGVSDEALAVLRRKRKAMRVLTAPAPGPAGPSLRSVDGGLLVQTPDVVGRDRSGWTVPTGRTPSESEWEDAIFAWQVCAGVGSNAFVLARDRVAVGIGAGQQSRVDAARIAARKADGRARDGACASDAFYPFRDGLDAAAEAGVAVVIQPGGSVRDDEVTQAADEHGLAMILTGERHFRH
ncbi:MAG: bifunctional phosphoribosylaminoimidazolecarboxamide formyltransferase/IMP cyclohydrolase [Trueperaceae bacterium]